MAGESCGQERHTHTYTLSHTRPHAPRVPIIIIIIIMNANTNRKTRTHAPTHRRLVSPVRWCPTTLVLFSEKKRNGAEKTLAHSPKKGPSKQQAKQNKQAHSSALLLPLTRKNEWEKSLYHVRLCLFFVPIKSEPLSETSEAP